MSGRRSGMLVACLRDIPTAHNELVGLLRRKTTCPISFMPTQVPREVNDLRSASVPSDQSLRWVSPTLNRLSNQSQGPPFYGDQHELHIPSKSMRYATTTTR